MRLKFYTLDVFTDVRFGGNPLAVVLDADGLETAQMHKIAREFNLSETVFVLRPQNPAHNARVRIFTPTSELPFAGHPTVGTAILLAGLRAKAQPGSATALVLLEEVIGSVRVGVRMASGKPAFAEFDAPRLPTETGGVPTRDIISAAIGLLPGEIGFANHKPRRMTAGGGFLFVPVISLEAMAKAAPNLSRWNALTDDGEGIGVYLYTGETVHSTSQYHARMFAPHHGVLEDPATGSAAAAFAGIIQLFDQLPDGTHKRQIEQGYEMGRPSRIYLSVDVARGALSTVRIGGHAVQVTEGEIIVAD